MKIDIGKVLMGLGMILMFFLLFGAFGALTGCEPKTHGPPLETECKYSTPIKLSVVEYESQDELNRKWEYYNQAKLPVGANASGFAIYNLVTETHTLHVLKVRGQNDDYRIETLGHELMHSFCGDWHPRNGY